MRNLSGLLNKLTAVAAVAVALTSCNRAEYAMLPQTSSYHGGAYHSVAVKPAAPAEAVAPAATAPVAAPAQEVAVVAPAAAPAVVVPAPAAVAKPAVAASVAPRKLNLMERALVNKVTKKADKLASKLQFKQHTETASTTKLSGNLRTGVILLLLGLVISLLSFVSGIFGLIGSIIAIVGLIFIILYLLDQI